MEGSGREDCDSLWFVDWEERDIRQLCHTHGHWSANLMLVDHSRLRELTAVMHIEVSRSPTQTSAQSPNEASTSRASSQTQEVVERRRPVAPYIPASRAHPSDAFTGYSEPIAPGESPYVSIRGLYSSSDFDTLSVLSRVYTRPNPKIELGPVDDSVSFVVVDSQKHDSPIVYCSQNFYKLTGYKPEEIVGRNCVRILSLLIPEIRKASALSEMGNSV